MPRLLPQGESQGIEGSRVPWVLGVLGSQGSIGGYKERSCQGEELALENEKEGERLAYMQEKRTRGCGGAGARKRITHGLRRTRNPRAAKVIRSAEQTREKRKMHLR